MPQHSVCCSRIFLQPVVAEFDYRQGSSDGGGQRADEEVRLEAARTDCARAQVWALRERLLKLCAQVGGSVRRVVIHLPVSFPFLRSFRKIALAFGASRR